jgi:1-aminocyclopropane-1-carboxylate deaminase/D-cysteine desulfhydrase-like pyridoxal-dependent ACC family enzyme
MLKSYNDIRIDIYNGVYVLRDDLLTGGTKSRFLPSLLDPNYEEFVYASPVYGGFQIALASVCLEIGKKATIFCAKRKTPHRNSIRVKNLGGNVMQVKSGYLSVVEKRARDYCEAVGAKKLVFGANDPKAIESISETMKEISNLLGFEPDQIFLPVGSGTLLKGVVKGTKEAKIFGVQVGKEFEDKVSNRVAIIKYPKPFDYESKYKSPFPSCSNYDLKAWEICEKMKNKNKRVLFWNVLD